MTGWRDELKENKWSQTRSWWGLLNSGSGLCFSDYSGIFNKNWYYQYNTEQAATIYKSDLFLFTSICILCKGSDGSNFRTMECSYPDNLRELNVDAFQCSMTGNFYQPGCWQVGLFYDSHAQQWSTYYRSSCGGSVCVCLRCRRTRWGIKALLCTVCFQDGWAEAIFVMARWLSHEFSTRYPSPVSLTSCFSKGSFITCVNFTYR